MRFLEPHEYMQHREEYLRHAAQQGQILTEGRIMAKVRRAAAKANTVERLKQAKAKNDKVIRARVLRQEVAASAKATEQVKQNYNISGMCLDCNAVNQSLVALRQILRFWRACSWLGTLTPHTPSP